MCAGGDPRPTVMVFCEYFLPSGKAGGPAKSVNAIVSALNEQYRFLIVSRDRDRGDRSPYESVRSDRFQTAYGTEVMYVSPGWRGLRSIWRALADERPDTIYLNSFFSPEFSLFVWAVARLRSRSPALLVIAPRGELAQSALNIKRAKKQLFLVFARLVRLYANARWHAASDKERDEIVQGLEARLGLASIDPEIAIAPPPIAIAPAVTGVRVKETGNLKIAFASRISRVKNLDVAIRVVQGLKGAVTFDIYGPYPRRDDREYWASCRQLLHRSPADVSIRYRGTVPRDAVVGVLAEYHVLLLPSAGENFGHVIAEALSAGCIVCISDRTPWRDLAEHGAGWDLPLAYPEQFTAALQTCVDMGQDAFDEASANGRRYLAEIMSPQRVIEHNQRLFAPSESSTD